MNMEEIVEGDPFLWDVDRVVRELCTTNRSWQAPPAQKLPDPVDLEALLREQEVDGETLLTYSDTFDTSSLWEVLGIKKAPHRLSINKAIKQFQKRSPRFRQWKLEQLNDNHSEDGQDTSGDSESRNGTLTRLSSGHEVALGAVVNSVGLLNGSGDAAGEPSVSMNPPQSAVSAAPLPPASVNDPKRGLENGHTPGDFIAEKTSSDGPPAKKRRVELTFVSSAPVHENGTLVPTEGDELLARRTEGNLIQTDNLLPGYLGDAAPVSGRVFDGTSSDDELEQISWVRHKSILPGRRLQVIRTMKRLLRSGPFVMARAEGVDDEDEVLPVFGESDDEQSLDSETWNAIQREEERSERRKAAKKAAKESQLQPDKVAEAVERAIQHLEVDWVSTKKPKYDYKARKIWDLARLDPNRQNKIRQLKADCEMLGARIEKLTEEFIRDEWQDESQVEELVPAHLGVSIAERERKKWELKLIESPHQPPRLKAPPKAEGRRNMTPENSDEDEESISSDINDSDSGTESDIDGLIAQNHSRRDEMEVDSPEPEQHIHSRSQSADPEAVLEIESIRSLPQSPSSTPKLKSELTFPATPRHILPPPAGDFIEIQSSPMVLETDETPPLRDVERIAKIGIEHWQNVGDKMRLVIAVLAGWNPEPRVLALIAVESHKAEGVWNRFIQPLVDRIALSPSGLETAVEGDPDSPSLLLARLFDCFISNTAARMRNHALKILTLQRIQRDKPEFESFCRLLLEVSPYFLGMAPQTPTARIKIVSRSDTVLQETPSQTDRVEMEDDSDEIFSDESLPEDSPMKRRRRKRAPDKVAEKLRLTTVNQKEEFEKRRLQLRLEQASEAIPSNKSRLIVNETKDPGQALIYINYHIGQKIKNHQIEGVRFLWDHIVKSDTRQGCLLAHEMGLGKTMQAITLLVVIAEAAKSNDPSIRSQIPEQLRESKTLILCPAGLVDNWFDEILMWASEETLGQIHKLDRSVKEAARIELVESWAANGGILLIGYQLFTALVMKGDAIIRTTLHETPNIVIADEAHNLKNTNSQRHQASGGFKTTSRIALTGSPLTSHVMDYYAMINWVAPNYLADIAEFKSRFEGPINDGLYVDSDSYTKRKSRKMLHILKETVGPKVNRKGVQVLLDELPGKKEFIISVPLTAVQFKAYTAYINLLQARSLLDGVVGNSRIWTLVSMLSRLMAHPRIFQKNLEDRKKEDRKKKAMANEKSNDDTILDELHQDSYSELLATMSGLKDLADPSYSHKVQVLFQILDECKKIGDKVLVFSQSISTLDYLSNAFRQQRRNFKRLDGSTDVGSRQEAVKEFNNDPTSEVYLISTRAGGVGLNIFGANRVVIFDFKFTPAEEQQAIGRSYRIGQSKKVFVYWLTVGGTFEGAIHNRAVFKTQLASRIVDKKNPDPYANRNKEYFKLPTIPDQEDLSHVRGKDDVLDVLLSSETLKGVVRKVIPTETFEKEEVYELSAEDKLEVEADIEMERLRIHNPEEYKRREQLRQFTMGSGLLSHIAPSSSAPPATRPIVLPSVRQQGSIRHPTLASVGAGVPTHMPPPLTAPTAAPAASLPDLRQQGPIRQSASALAGAGVPAHMSLPPTVRSHPAETPAFTTPGPSHVALPNGGGPSVSPTQPKELLTNRPAQPDPPTIWDALPAAQRVPVPTAHSASLSPNDQVNNDVMGQPPTPASDQPATKPTVSDRPLFSGSLLGGPNSMTSNSPKLKSNQRELEPILGSGTQFKHPPEALPQSLSASKLLEDQLLESLSKARATLNSTQHATLVPRDLLSSVLSALDKLGYTGLPRMDVLQNLNKCAQEHRFAEALLAGYLKPEQLAEMGRAQLLEEAKKLSNMEEPAFNSMVWAHAAPEVGVEP